MTTNVVILQRLHLARSTRIAAWCTTPPELSITSPYGKLAHSTPHPSPPGIPLVPLHLSRPILHLPGYHNFQPLGISPHNLAPNSPIHERPVVAPCTGLLFLPLLGGLTLRTPGMDEGYLVLQGRVNEPVPLEAVLAREFGGYD